MKYGHIFNDLFMPIVDNLAPLKKVCPFSNLPAVSKIFERNVYDQLSKHLDKRDILYKYQSGLRRSYSTETALINLSDRIKFSMEKGLYTGMVMIDLQKAFDTVNHAIMSDKLGAVGCDDGSVNWSNSYLSNRFQFIDIKGTLSDRGEVTCVVYPRALYWDLYCF